MNQGEEYLLKLQAEPKTKHGYNSRLKAWVDDHSEVARVLRSMDED